MRLNLDLSKIEDYYTRQILRQVIDAFGDITNGAASPGVRGATGQKGDKGDIGISVTGPQGSPGIDGDDGYTIAVANGFVGTSAAWLLSLKGTNGSNGSNGTNGTNGTNGIDGSNAYDSPYVGPDFTYTSGDLTRIDYEDGSYKLLTYVSGVLDQIDFYVFGSANIKRKNFIYSGGALIRIDESII